MLKLVKTLQSELKKIDTDEEKIRKDKSEREEALNRMKEAQANSGEVKD